MLTLASPVPPAPSQILPVSPTSSSLLFPTISSILTLFSQSAYEASDTTITPLGSAQTYQSGIQFREKYLTNDSSSAVAGVDWPLVNLQEVDFMAE